MKEKHPDTVPDNDSDLPWEALNAKNEFYAAAGDKEAAESYVAGPFDTIDFEEMGIEELAILAALQSKGAVSDDILEKETHRIFGIAEQKAQEDIASGKIANEEEYILKLRQVLISYAEGAERIPSPSSGHHAPGRIFH